MDTPTLKTCKVEEDLRPWPGETLQCTAFFFYPTHPLCLLAFKVIFIALIKNQLDKEVSKNTLYAIKCRHTENYTRTVRAVSEILKGNQQL